MHKYAIHNAQIGKNPLEKLSKRVYNETTDLSKQPAEQSARRNR